MDLTHFDPVQFRNQSKQTTPIYDLDLIEIYIHLPVERKQDIAQRLNAIMLATKDPKKDKLLEYITLGSLELTIRSCQNLFLNAEF